jgi:hypothetical protein
MGTHLYNSDSNWEIHLRKKETDRSMTIKTPFRNFRKKLYKI